jgi:hypothetical protein
VVMMLMATSMATLSHATQVGDRGKRLSLGEILSGWRDLNSRPLDPQTLAARPRTSPDVQFSLEIRILDLDAFRWTKANGGQAHS